MTETWIPREGDLVTIEAEWRPDGHTPPVVGLPAKVRSIYTTTGELDGERNTGGRRVMVLQFSPDGHPKPHFDYFDLSRQPYLYMVSGLKTLRGKRQKTA